MRRRCACGVRDSRFRKPCDLSAVIHGGGLPVISVQHREGAHLALAPKERATRKFCAETADVFAVGVYNRCFGITHCLPSIVDLTAKGVIPTVVSSERADVECESVDVYPDPPFYKLPRLQESVLGLRPPAIVDAHGAAEKPIVQSTQILNSVALLSERIAEAAENNRRNSRYAEIPQPS